MLIDLPDPNIAPLLRRPEAAAAFADRGESSALDFLAKLDLPWQRVGRLMLISQASLRLALGLPATGPLGKYAEPAPVELASKPARTKKAS